MDKNREIKANEIKKARLILKKLRFSIVRMESLGFDESILQNIYPHITYIQKDLDKLLRELIFDPERENPEQEMNQNRHKSINR